MRVNAANVTREELVTLSIRLSAPLARAVLRKCVAKWDEETDAIKQRPSYVRSGYFAYGPEKRAARRLWALGLLDDASSFGSTGADLYPSPLGIELARQLVRDAGVPMLARRFSFGGAR